MRSSMLTLLVVLLLAPAGALASEGAGADPETAPAAGAAPEAPAEAPQAADEAEAVDPAAGTAEPEPPASAAPTAAAEPPASEAAPAPAVPDAPLPAAAPEPLAGGHVGYDAEGRQGWVHVVAPHDTLWDISDAYLGTPWVWPSVWTDNREIANPHLIHPGDHIWITRGEMRRVSESEAEQLMAGAPAAEPVAAPEVEVAEEEPPRPVLQIEQPERRDHVHRFSRDGVGLISAQEMESAASIVDAIPARVMLGQGDEVYIGLGEDRVSKGDQFTIFRKLDEVRDPDTRKVLGYHVDILGWLEVHKVHPETSLAKIELSVAEVERGDRLIWREPLPLEIPVGESPGSVEGRISFFPRSRTLMGETDYVYLNRGTLDGLEVGSPLEVYREGYRAEERARDEKVRVPDRVIAGLLVVRAQPESSVAFVTYSDEELELGDHFRGAKR